MRLKDSNYIYRMKKIKIIGSIITVLLFMACSKKPSASFKTDLSTVEENQSITFSNTSEDADSYEWDFGDGSGTSTEASPSHAFQNAGIYSVKLTAYSKGKKKSGSTSQSISVSVANYRFSGNVDGQAKLFISDDVNYETVIGSTSILSGSINKVRLECSIGEKVNQGNEEFIRLNIGNLLVPNTTSDAGITQLFKDYIGVKSYNYSPAGPINGVIIEYIDKNGGFWSSNLGSANQTGSSFTITSASYKKDFLAFEEILFKANFNVKLYNSTGAGVKQITNGYMYCTMENPLQ